MRVCRRVKVQRGVVGGEVEHRYSNQDIQGGGEAECNLFSFYSKLLFSLM